MIMMYFIMSEDDTNDTKGYQELLIYGLPEDLG